MASCEPIDEGMKIALILFDYFPFGGLQRDCLKTAKTCVARGHDVTIITRTWQGDLPENIELRSLGRRGLTNVSRNCAFIRQAIEVIRSEEFHVVAGFNKMPGLDVYYGADPCFAAKSERLKGFWYRWTSRYRHYHKMERAVFHQGARTQIALLTAGEIPLYQQYYGTEEDRLHVVPPGIQKRSFSVEEQRLARTSLRKEFSWAETDYLMLLVGSGFKTKGLDRAIHALASLPSEVRGKTRLAVVGQDRAARFQKLARRLGVADQVRFVGGRDNVFDFLLAADVLIHPAYSEAGGMVLLEALTAGLPVIATDVCGYAPHVVEANAGIILKSPFRQADCDAAVRDMLTSPQHERRQNAVRYASTHDLYSCHTKIAELIESVGEKGR